MPVRTTGRKIARRHLEEHVAELQTGKIKECRLIHPPLELDHRFQWYPVIAPAPSIEFRVIARTQANIGVTPHQPEQKPDLLLPPISVSPLPLDPVLGHVIAQPAARAANDADVLRLQADFFEELTVHSLFRRFAVLDSALRKLPGMFSYPFAPENFVARIHQNDADVRPIAFTVEHGATFNS